MPWLAAFALAASTPAIMPATRVTAQAQASITIITGVRLKLDGSLSDGAPPPRETVVHTSAGETQPAKLVEFQ